jgi:hypothetical protein
MFGLFFDPEDGGDISPRNIGKFLNIPKIKNKGNHNPFNNLTETSIKMLF